MFIAEAFIDQVADADDEVGDATQAELLDLVLDERPPGDGDQGSGKVPRQRRQPDTETPGEDDGFHGLQGAARLSGVLVEHIHRAQPVRGQVLVDQVRLVEKIMGRRDDVAADGVGLEDVQMRSFCEI